MQVDTVFRLDAASYEQLERKILSDVIVSDKTTEIQAGYMLGIQKVLREIRNGFTIG